MSEPFKDPRWSVGDRVTYPVFLRDGTWEREVDVCLSRSPLLHGTITAITREPTPHGTYYRPPLMHEVAWDDGTTGRYFAHGLESE